MSVDSQTSKLLALVTDTADLVIFQPDASQRRAKGNFWSYFTDSDAPLPQDITLALALKFGADRRIGAWWDSREFRDWFCNKDEFRQRLEYLTHLALDSAEEILISKTVSAQAKVAMAKLIIEAANKMPKGRADDKFLDERVAQMDRKQLEEFIRKSVRILPSADKSLTITEGSDSIIDT